MAKNLMKLLLDKKIINDEDVFKLVSRLLSEDKGEYLNSGIISLIVDAKESKSEILKSELPIRFSEAMFEVEEI